MLMHNGEKEEHDDDDGGGVWKRHLEISMVGIEKKEGVDIHGA